MSPSLTASPSSNGDSDIFPFTSGTISRCSIGSTVPEPEMLLTTFPRVTTEVPDEALVCAFFLSLCLLNATAPPAIASASTAHNEILSAFFFLFPAEGISLLPSAVFLFGNLIINIPHFIDVFSCAEPICNSVHRKKEQLSFNKITVLS